MYVCVCVFVCVCVCVCVCLHHLYFLCDAFYCFQVDLEREDIALDLNDGMIDEDIDSRFEIEQSLNMSLDRDPTLHADELSLPTEYTRRGARMASTLAPAVSVCFILL